MSNWKMVLAMLVVSAALTACDKQEKADVKPAAEAPAAPEEAKKEVAKAADAGAAAKVEEKAEEKADEALEVAAVVGKPAPTFELVDEAGAKHNLEQYKGKTVVLEWTCPTCPYVERHYESKTMASTHETVGTEDVVWLAIDSTKVERAVDLQEWKTKEGFSYPVLLDRDGATGKAYGAKTTPHMYVIDPEGVLRYQGAIDNNDRGKLPEGEVKNFVIDAVNAIKEGKDLEQSETKPYGCSVKYAS
ncbi:MAG: redoxin domain-containing protein [Myxococcota bacterium]